MSSPSCARVGVLICGVIGSGKTSLIRMLNGYSPTHPNHFLSEAPSRSMTRLYRINNTQYWAIDTPGFSDHRDENDRDTLFNGILQTIHREQIKVKKILILMSGTERLNEADLPWFADLMAATRVDINQLILVLTKLETPFDIQHAQQHIQNLQQVFKRVKIITCGCSELNDQGMHVSQVMEQFSNLESLPDINVQPNFQTCKDLLSMLSSLENDMKCTEINHNICVAEEKMSNEHQINAACEQLHKWRDRYDEAVKSRCPIFGDKTTSMQQAREAMEQLKNSIEALRNGEISVSQSLADVAHFHQTMLAIQDDLESRSGFLSLFRNLITT